MQRSGGNNGNIYDLRKDLQRPQAPSQKKETSGSTDSRYGFNGEPLSFAPDRTSNGAVRRTRTDNSIEFPTQPHRTAQSSAPRTRSQARTAAHRVPALRLQAGTAPARPAGPSSAGPRASRPGRRQTEPPASATKISACARRSNSRSGTRCGGKNARNAA